MTSELSDLTFRDSSSGTGLSSKVRGTSSASRRRLDCQDPVSGIDALGDCGDCAGGRRAWRMASKLAIWLASLSYSSLPVKSRESPSMMACGCLLCRYLQAAAKDLWKLAWSSRAILSRSSFPGFIGCPQIQTSARDQRRHRFFRDWTEVPARQRRRHLPVSAELAFHKIARSAFLAAILIIGDIHSGHKVLLGNCLSWTWCVANL
jgi:hypothetical protein